MAAHAAVLSLLNAVGRIENHLIDYKSAEEQHDIDLLKASRAATECVEKINYYRTHAGDLGEMGIFLRAFLETYCHGNNEDAGRATEFVESINHFWKYEADLGEMSSSLKEFLKTYSHGNIQDASRAINFVRRIKDLGVYAGDLEEMDRVLEEILLEPRFLGDHSEVAGRAREFMETTDHYRKSAGNLGKMGSFLKEFLEKYYHGDSEEERDLERQIVNFARRAEDAIENCVVDHITYGLGRCESFHTKSLDRVEKTMQFIKQKVMRIHGLRKSKDQPLPKYSVSPTSSSNAPAITGLESAMVGLEDEQLQIMERLTCRDHSSHQVIPIVGMGGIGKTKLARSIYENRPLMHHFDIQIWITISQECTLRGLLLQIPVCRKEQNNSESLIADNQLGEVLYKFLSHKRYLIILDDMWNIEVWKNIELFFPNNDCTSRIVVTTRLSNVAAHFGSPILKMSFLDQDNSWKLFCKTAFGQNVGCPLELENIGKDIATKCKGLPISIITIGGLLMKSGRIKEYWESVANDINSFLDLGDEQHCHNVLLLSYNHLPAHLKSCFLYMGIFPEDQEIHISQLINLWIAEGFINLDDKFKSWEETAEDCLKDLINRNLILIGRRGLNRKIKTCYLHDLLRDLCLRIVDKEEFLCVLRNRAIPQGLHNERRIAFHGKHLSQDFHDILYPLHPRTLMCDGGILPWLVKRSLCILDAVDINSFKDVLDHVNLRYIGCRLTSVRSIPPLISHLWNLQTMICNNTSLVTAPFEIWTMKQLRHFEFSEICLPSPHLEGLVACVLQDVRAKMLEGLDENLLAKELDDYILRKQGAKGLDDYVWPNIQTLTTLVNFKCTKEVLVIFRPVKKLKLKYEDFQWENNKIGADFCLLNVNGFSMLESLKVSFYVKQSMKMDLQGCLTYPSSLKKLTLDNIELCWDDLASIGSLPNLEDLKLTGSIAGSMWTPIEGGFCSLKSLRIFAYIDLIHWNADRSHFPILEIINLGGVPCLEVIPSDIGNIPTIKVIQFCSCRAPTAISALKILVEQESHGNRDLQVRVTFMNAMEERSFQIIVESESLESNNFIIETGT